MRSNIIRSKEFSRRALVLAGLKASLLVALMGRLYYLQIIKSEKYKTLSDSNRIRLSIIPPKRGKIIDAHGEEIAVNQNFYRILFDPVQARKPLVVLEHLAGILGLTLEQQELMLQRVKDRVKGRRVVMLYDHLTWQQVARVEVRAPELEGVLIDSAQKRYYPENEVMAHVLGYVGAVSPEEKERNNPLLDHPDFQIGKVGIEKNYDLELRGKAGFKRSEVNAYGRQVRELSRESSIEGHDIRLSLHTHMQRYITSRLPETGGAAVLLNVVTGEVMSMVSTPGFNPNQFVQSISQEAWSALQHNMHKPLINRAVAKQYPPGSTFKLISALAGFEMGIDPQEEVHCPGYYDFGDRRFHCWRKDGHGSMDLHNAIKYSCNTYFYTMSQRVGINMISTVARDMGLGQLYNLGVTGEMAGLVPDRHWKKQKLKRVWLKGDTLNVSIGQGYALTTPLQLAVMVARIAREGVLVTPTIRAVSEDALPEFGHSTIAASYFQQVKKAMESVVNGYRGTARGSKLNIRGFEMAGKTGTSQVVARHVNEDKDEEDIPFLNKNHALFVGYAPLDKPRYALSVVVDHGGSGATASAPLAHDIFKELYRYERMG